MTHSSFSRAAGLAAALTLGLALGWLLFHHARRSTTAEPARSADLSVSEVARADVGGAAGATTIYAHNLMLRKGPQFRIYIRWIRGEMRRTRADVIPSFDDPDSFVLAIQRGVIHANIGDVSTFLNKNMPAKAPLTNVSIEPDGTMLKLRGTAQKVVPLPVEITGELSPTPDGRVRFHAVKINVLKVPLKGLLRGFHLSLSDLVPASQMPGIQVAGDDIFFDTEWLLPPPHIYGKMRTIRVSTPDLEVMYGDLPSDGTPLKRWHNFLRLEGGTIGIGKLTMHNTDLTMIDASEGAWFDLDLVNYKAQLINGYTRVTEQAGLEIFMPDVGPGSEKRVLQPKLSLDWLKDRSQALPGDIPTRIRSH